MKPRQFVRIVKRIAKKYLVERRFYKKQRKMDEVNGTFFDYERYPNYKILFPVSFSTFDVEGINTEHAKSRLEEILRHEFDLLGCNHIQQGYFDNAPGINHITYHSLKIETPFIEADWLTQIITEKNVDIAKKIYQLIPNKEYRPIDWQKDYKSGYRWNGKTYYLEATKGTPLGADIKIPWEMSRFYHLPELAIIYKKLNQNEEAYQEFICEVLDFIATNPPRYGVNWASTMDVGIRLANLVVAYCMFQDFGAKFSNDFIKIVSFSIYTHCKHIYENIEKHALFDGNHYLADMCGLLFGACTISDSLEAKNWEKEAAFTIKKQLFLQFYEDGGNFESSTTYHHLASELVAYTMPLMEAIGYPVSFQEKERLYQIYQFNKWIETPSGEPIMVGDNDSGHFFNMFWSVKRMSIVDGFSMMFDETCENCIAAQFMNCLLPNTKWNGNYQEFKQKEIQIKKNSLTNFRYTKEWGVLGNPAVDYSKGVQLKSFPMFGIYIWKSDNVYLCFNATGVGQEGNGGHAHNDKLSFELWFDKTPIFRDPGTSYYTPFPSERNKSRSEAVHNVIHSGVEQNRFVSMFSTTADTKCDMLLFTKDTIIAYLQYRNIKQMRKIKLSSLGIHVTDYSNKPIVEKDTYDFMTNGYGNLVEGNKNHENTIV